MCNILSASLLRVEAYFPEFSFYEIKLKSVANELINLKAKKVAGLDNIFRRLLKSSADLIAPSLTYTYNLSLGSCTFPIEWRTAKVITLFKVSKKGQIIMIIHVVTHDLVYGSSTQI